VNLLARLDIPIRRIMKRGRCHAKTKACEEFSIEIYLKKNEEFIEESTRFCWRI